MIIRSFKPFPSDFKGGLRSLGSSLSRHHANCTHAFRTKIFGRLSLSCTVVRWNCATDKYTAGQFLQSECWLTQAKLYILPSCLPQIFLLSYFHRHHLLAFFSFAGILLTELHLQTEHCVPTPADLEIFDKLLLDETSSL